MKAAYPHCADRLFGRPHAIEPNALRALIEGPAGRRILSGERPAEAATGDALAIRKKRLAMVEADPVTVANGCGEYALTSEGIAIVPVMGVLSQRFDWLAALCGWTTYEGLAATFAAMLSDYRVRAILMDVDSPGGEAAGMLDAADLILAARAVKPVWAVANTFAASAAFALAGSADTLYVPRLAIVGSIGAVCVHVDQSAQDQAYGERYTAIYAGARKIDGWEHAPLSDAAQSAFQRGVDHCRAQFCELVGRQGRMSAADALATEAGIYHDQDAVTAGLADRVGSFDQALTDLTAELNGNTSRAATAASTQGETGMSKIVRNGAARGNNGASGAALAILPAAPAAAAEADPARDDDDDNGNDEVDPNDDDDQDEKMTAPKAGEACALCGQVMPKEEGKAADGGDDADPDSNAAHAQHIDLSARLGEISAILDLCASQNVSLAEARGFVKAKTSLAAVRETIAAAKANAADAAGLHAINPGDAANAASTVMKEAHQRVKGRTKSAFAR